MSLCSHEKFSCYHLYSLAENQTVPNVRSLEKSCFGFPPKAASASCQDLITASYKTLLWQSKWSKFPFLSSLHAQQGTGTVQQQRGLHSSHIWSEHRLGRGGWGGQTDFASPPAFLLHTMDSAALNRQYFKILLYDCFLSFYKDLLGALQK